MTNSMIYILTGPSGAGKSTIGQSLLSRMRNLKRVITCTTRAPRDGEKEGIDYYFKRVDEFEMMIKCDELVEHAKVYGNYYGSRKADVQKILDSGNQVLYVIDVQGALAIKKMYPEISCTIFVKTPSIEVLKERLKKRGQNDASDLAHRLEIAVKELRQENSFDYIVINDDLNQAIDECYQILQKG